MEWRPPGQVSPDARGQNLLVLKQLTPLVGISGLEPPDGLDSFTNRSSESFPVALRYLILILQEP